MNSVLIIAVNYNSYSQLYEFLDKAIDSKEACDEPFALKVIVADNSTKREKIDVEKYKSIDLEVCQLDNLGYLGGAQRVINNLESLNTYDFIAISNVDLALDISFFNVLFHNTYPHNIGWIAPSIFSLQEGRDKKTLTRPPKWKIVIMREIYRIPILYRLYYKTAYKRKRIEPQNLKEQDIYAGHGAFILLTKHFFNTYRQLNYPVFLFCEENYLAELVRKAGMIVRYYPSLKIWDSEHVSVGKINFKRQCELNYNAVDYIIKNFY